MSVRLWASRFPPDLDLDKVRSLIGKEVLITLRLTSMKETGFAGENEYFGRTRTIRVRGKITSIGDYGIFMKGTCNCLCIEYDRSKGKFVEVEIPEGQGYCPFHQSQEYFSGSPYDRYANPNIDEQSIESITHKGNVIFETKPSWGANYHIKEERR